MRTAHITIDTQALTHNLQQVAQHAPQSKILAMIKANAYGHGVAMCLPALDQADGIGVATYDEAQQARLLGWSEVVVMIEGVFSQHEWQQALNLELSSVIHHQPQVDWALQNLPSADSPSRHIWLKLNTGMNRLGFDPDSIIHVAQKLHDAGYQLILTSHFANADDINHPLNASQINCFHSVLTRLRQQVSPHIQASLCNSAGIINFPDSHFDWVRAGIMLYGSSPVVDKTAAQLHLKPVMNFHTALMAIHPVKVGESIGYGSRFIANKPLNKGIISIGYGDGYPRVINESAYVTLYQQEQAYHCQILGRVAMDMIAIDLSSIPNPTLGSTVVLWGDDTQQAPHIDEVANWANTISYELLCRLSSRPTRSITNPLSCEQ